jgi:hypothetical protein
MLHWQGQRAMFRDWTNYRFNLGKTGPERFYRGTGEGEEERAALSANSENASLSKHFQMIRDTVCGEAATLGYLPKRQPILARLRQGTHL